LSRSLRIYIYVLSAAFWCGLAAALMHGPLVGFDHPYRLAPLFGLAVAVEALSVQKQENTIGFSAVAHLATAVLFGPVAAAAIAAVAVVLVDGVRSRQFSYILMNSAMFGTAAWCAGMAFQLTGGTVGKVTPDELLPLVALVATRLIVNEVIFSGAIAMMHRSFVRVLRDSLRDSVGQSIGEGCLGVLLAFGYTGDRWVILPFLLPLLAALYQAQSSFERLKRETKAALDALAGVIDERDPLTMQHSERVAELVDRFTQAIQLPEREATRLVDAARFHDLGKVAVDVSTLSKEGRLDDAELRAIRSHPRLSARLLAPFGFAQQIALYAELHHERYDGRGYYGVAQPEIPVEAHVLIAADSYDAMTSKRAYRPALTPQEAVAELRDKSGSQFHPLVAQAFAAMIEGGDVDEAIGRSQLAALRAEFSRAPLLAGVNLSSLIGAGQLTVAQVALALVASGVQAVPRWVPLVLGTGAVMTGAWALAGRISGQRRSGRAMSALESGSAPGQALRAAGIDCWAVWLEFRRESFEYEPRVEGEVLPDAEELSELCKRALRPGSWGRRGSLASGLWFEITKQDSTGVRLAVGGPNRLSSFESGLVEQVATRTRATAVDSPRPSLAVVGGDERRGGVWHPAVIVIELNAFENVRQVAGQLSAERVESEAVSRLRTLLRDGDRLHRLGEDRFALIVPVTEQSQIEGVSRRVDAALSSVPVPHRADPIKPVMRTYVHGEIAADPQLAALVAEEHPSESRKAG
jgi:hypothetical protein